MLEEKSMLSESIWDRVCRVPLAIAYCLHPNRIRFAPKFLAASAASWLRGGVDRPRQDRLVRLQMLFGGLARNVTPEAVLDANRLGFFLESHAGPQKWWTLDKRMVIRPNAPHINKRLRSQIRNSGFKFTLDREFSEVVKQCAEPRPGRPRFTWIRPDIAAVYDQLFKLGYAHSFEIWDRDGTLVGGGYGLAIGKVFVLESMFHRARQSSKVGLVALNYHLNALGFVLNDSKAFGSLYDRLGYRLISRAEHEEVLRQAAGPEWDNPGHWEFTSDLSAVSDWGKNGERRTPDPKQASRGATGQKESLTDPSRCSAGL